MAVIKGQPTPPKGKNFIGWQVGKSSLVIAGGSFQLKSEDATNGDVTLTARYADKASRLTSVTYNANGGTIKGNATYTDGSTVVNDDYKIISDVPVWENHNFLGWSTDANATKPMFKAGETVAVGNDARLRKTGNDLYAVWKMIPEKVTVFIIGNSDIVTFDGEEHKVEGYKVNSTNESYTENDFVFNGNAVASGTEEGTYNMGLKASMFENRNEKFEVLFEVEDGVLEIKKTDVLPDHEDEQFDEEENEEDFDGNGNGDEKKQKSYVKGAEDEPDSYVKGKTADVKNTDTNASNRGDSDGSVVRTGDDNPLPLLILLMLMTIAMTTAVVIRFRSSAKV